MQTELSTVYTVRISDCDASGRWRATSILVQMQELAETHSAALNLSRATLISQGMCWILYRQYVQMDVYPTFGDRVRLTTWPGAIDGPLFPRYFLLEREDGSPLGAGATSWILMDIHTRRPMRPSALPGKVPIANDRPAPLPLPGMLRIQNATPLLSRTVRFSDLDVNGHMNNTRYLDWICDGLDLAELNAHGLAAWQINYIAEARPEETLQLLARQEGRTTLVQGTRASDGRAVFEASVTLGGA